MLFLYCQIPRPDGNQDMIGLTVLDEPCASQSDPTVLDLQLRAISKQTTAKQIVSGNSSCLYAVFLSFHLFLLMNKNVTNSEGCTFS